MPHCRLPGGHRQSSIRIQATSHTCRGCCCHHITPPDHASPRHPRASYGQRASACIESVCSRCSAGLCEAGGVRHARTLTPRGAPARACPACLLPACWRLVRPRRASIAADLQACRRVTGGPRTDGARMRASRGTALSLTAAGGGVAAPQGSTQRRHDERQGSEWRGGPRADVRRQRTRSDGRARGPQARVSEVESRRHGAIRGAVERCQVSVHGFNGRARAVRRKGLRSCATHSEALVGCGLRSPVAARLRVHACTRVGACVWRGAS